MSENGKLPQSELAPIAQGQLRKDAAAAWNAMNVESRRRGLELVPTGSASSYRTLAQQEALYQEMLNGGNLAAVPGTSNHGWGTAVDTPDQRHWTMIEQIGRPYGYSKAWSDAPSEPWHVCFQPGHYSGPDPGPYGTASIIPELPEDTVSLFVILNKDGRVEVFVQQSDGEVWHAWQKSAGGAFEGAQTGVRNATWFTLGTPGK
jgi:hypothetical protein